MFLWWKKSMAGHPIIDELPEGDVFDKFSPDPKTIKNPAPADQAIELDPIPNGSPISSFDEIACQLELCLEETSDFDAKLKASDAKIKQIEIENDKLIKLNHELRARVGILEASVQNQRKHAGALDATTQRQRAEINNLHQAAKSKKTQKNQVDQINGLQNLVHRQQQEHTATILRHEILQSYAHKISEKAENLQLDLELLKCTTGGPQNAVSTEASVGMMHLTPQPFVAVLVDGDAYAWSNELFRTPAVRCPGALAAIRLKNEVTRYISEDSNIPPSSKVVARVYINAGQQNPSKKRISFGTHQLHLLDYFRVQFTEAMPLFDFVDVGRGKERADEKIRENFHLLLSNPYCHRVFLAVCTDNGFARMLEPYQYHTGAFEKIVLVSPGYVEMEIAPLGFREVCWPAVFAHRERALPMHQKQQKQLIQQAATAQVEMEELVHNQRIGLVGVTNVTAAKLVLDMVSSRWSGKTTMGGQRVRFGLKVYESTIPADVKIVENGTPLTKVGYECDVGLD